MKFSNFRKRHKPQSLLEAGASVFPSEAPWVHFNPASQSWNLGQWRLMESPLFFLVKHHCLIGEDRQPIRFSQVYGNCGEDPFLYGDSPEPFNERAVADFERSPLEPDPDAPLLNSGRRRVANWIDREKLGKILIGQLGPKVAPDCATHFLRYLDDPENRWRFGLFAALVLHGHPDGKKADARRILDSMNRSAAPGKDGVFRASDIRIDDAEKQIRKISATLPVADFPAIHASFENVLFMALLEHARRRGVLSTASFGWVKAFDRTLWYSFCQTGRRVCCAEAAGAWSHYSAEEAMGRPLHEPYMDIAIDGFEAEMADEGWIPGPGQDMNDVVADWLERGCSRDQFECLKKRGNDWKNIALAYEAGRRAAIREIGEKVNLENWSEK